MVCGWWWALSPALQQALPSRWGAWGGSTARSSRGWRAALQGWSSPEHLRGSSAHASDGAVGWPLALVTILRTRGQDLRVRVCV